MKTKTASLMVVLLFVPLIAFGGTFVAGEEVSIASDQTIEDNLYLAGGNISVSDPVLGDLIAAGGQILVTEDVYEDITLAGGNLTILGSTTEDVRVAGGSILMAGSIGGDLVAAGGSLTVAPNVNVGKDVVLAGGQLTLDGNVSGDVELNGGVGTINGHVKGDVLARIGEKLTLGPNAVIEGDLTFYGAHEDNLSVIEGATVTGEVTFKQGSTFTEKEVASTMAAVIGSFMLLKLAITLVTALILAWLFNRFTSSVVTQVIESPLKLLGIGFVALVVTPIAVLLLLVTVLGIPVALISLLGYLFTLVLSCVLSSIVVGAWVSKQFYKSSTIAVTWKNVTVGALILFIVKLIPVVGWILGFGVFLLTFGSIMHIVYNKLWRHR